MPCVDFFMKHGAIAVVVFFSQAKLKTFKRGVVCKYIFYSIGPSTENITLDKSEDNFLKHLSHTKNLQSGHDRSYCRRRTLCECRDHRNDNVR